MSTHKVYFPNISGEVEIEILLKIVNTTVYEDRGMEAFVAYIRAYHESYGSFTNIEEPSFDKPRILFIKGTKLLLSNTTFEKEYRSLINKARLYYEQKEFFATTKTLEELVA